MAKYLILIYGDEQRWDEETAAETATKDAGHRAYRVAVGDGHLGGHELKAASTATSWRSTATGEPILTDGPFLETKEALGGYYVLEADDLDAAIAHARRLPELASTHGGVEIRPIEWRG